MVETIRAYARSDASVLWGAAYTTQHLTVVEKIAAGRTTTRAVAFVRFVPFTRSRD
jgi:hypothetical protein